MEHTIMPQIMYTTSKSSKVVINQLSFSMFYFLPFFLTILASIVVYTLNKLTEGESHKTFLYVVLRMRITLLL